ncbi:hypothetical protein [Achromobacter sp. MFA1 R4]|uniref:hypothetical protein n=1 Tax=Achromobacter sp. MFA1 R4 TaxID=1881016 RepID=UPI0012EB59F5|nr:hypothetical protein [Achromobacter sp. MFA1 R4]
MMTFLDFFMGLWGTRWNRVGFALDIYGPGCLLRVWAILSHASGACHLNRNYQLIGNPVLRCSVEKGAPARRKHAAGQALKYNIGMPKYLFRPQTGLRQKLRSMSNILPSRPARRMSSARVRIRHPEVRP